MHKMNNEELRLTAGGEVITITAIMAVMVIGLIAVIMYRLFMASEGTATIPGGFKFTWE
ncbi:MAG: hypothetical protein WCX47_03160 [Bacilli bacterium]|jgi:hypothetical protein|nr:hypothetical protein [Bacilli bacterium]MDD3389494.1 hypothetical protein [Bacilli bacterium]MDD4345102.1 hypothetical protein [Bacilli bacterium]MDD4521133.1 hypothetical protein [Bacilli bacterium]MDY0399849.1 hypothetical protein [Bacilli bacterium]